MFIILGMLERIFKIVIRRLGILVEVDIVLFGWFVLLLYFYIYI